MSESRLLVKLRPSASLAAAEARANLRPIRQRVPGESENLGLAARAPHEAAWYIAEVADGGQTAWDAAHARVADQLGVSPSDVLFVEPDIMHGGVYPEDGENVAGSEFAVGEKCSNDKQDAGKGKKTGAGVAWHLGDNFTQLEKARSAVTFVDGDRVRIAHFDTGYYARHVTTPRYLNARLAANFVERDGRPNSAEDPDNKRLLFDNSGHGTGTLGILAGRAFPASGSRDLGGAPEAEVVPLRIADSVILLRTSAFASALDYAVDAQCDVGSMSMGGLPSRAWRDSVDRAYASGFCLVAAAGNNANGLITRKIVYPARYGRVIAACGVMANGAPYTNLSGLKTLEGNYGPDHVMRSAMSAYTPNIPWARFGCESAVRLNGEGTSSATPQIAAAVALWLQHYRADLPRDWRRVEAVRHALFTSARNDGSGNVHSRLGHGILSAHASLSIRPRLDLPQTKSDNDSFSILRVLTGLGVSESQSMPREEMFSLELMQLWLRNADFQALLPEGEATDLPDRKQLQRVMDFVIACDDCSLALRQQVAGRYRTVSRGTEPPPTANVVPAIVPACDAQPPVTPPLRRRLRVYATDPSVAAQLDRQTLTETTLSIRWEELNPGPSGEYVHVEDSDPSPKTYEPVDLSSAALLAQDGWAPSEGNAQFHQQMTYAVAMHTIERFEVALGRPVLWRPGKGANGKTDDSIFTQKLRIAPHALNHANAYYSPSEVSLQFGYFDSQGTLETDQVTGTRVYTCLSHDIVAHETTHAILDGMQRRFSEATNPDTLALHEGFADIVSLLQRFTMRELLADEIMRTRGDLESESVLGSLAAQFGRAMGGRHALREAIGHVENGQWVRRVPDPQELTKRKTPHARGAILVAAVFDAFLAIYKQRTRDLLRIATAGSGILPQGALHPDLVQRLATEASKAASHVLCMCIRALDYLPPVDVTFFEYLRGVITADVDLIGDDPLQYRVAFVESFRRWGIVPLPEDLGNNGVPRTLSVDTLRWTGLAHSKLSKGAMSHYTQILEKLQDYANASLYFANRKQLFDETRKCRAGLHRLLKQIFAKDAAFGKELGIDAKRPFEVHELRRASRKGVDAQYVPQLVVSLTQSELIETPVRVVHRGGCTLVIDLASMEVKYNIVKHIDSEPRRKRIQAFAAYVAEDPLRSLMFASGDSEPFAAVHALGGG